MVLTRYYRRLIGRLPRRKRFQLPDKLQPNPAPQHDLTVVAIAKDEGAYLAEWIAFHMAVGATKFIIYDNGSTDHSAEVLRPHVASGVVEVIPWPHFVRGFHTQALAYAHALAYAGHASRWMAFIDIDEFLFDPTGKSLPERLKDYADLPAVCVYRHHFGTSGHTEPPPGLVIEAFTQRYEPPEGPQKLRHFMVPKTIAQPSQVLGYFAAHHPILDQPRLWGFDENRRIVKRDRSAIFSAERLCINHYYSKDEATFARRNARCSTAANSIIKPGFYSPDYQRLKRGLVTDRRIGLWIGSTHEIMRSSTNTDTRLCTTT